MLDYELGDITFWVELGSRKPFPINVYREHGEWTFDAFTQGLSQQDTILIQGFIRERITDLEHVWGDKTRIHLNWQKKNRAMR